MIEQSDTWPEDEAQMTGLAIRGMRADGYSEDEISAYVTRQKIHMARVFDNETDFNRYKKELEFLLS